MASRHGERAEERAHQAMLLKKRSSVMQRQLPRPLKVGNFSFEEMAGEDGADALILQEMNLLMRHDAAKYPVIKSGKPAKQIKIEDFSVRIFISIILLCAPPLKSLLSHALLVHFGVVHCFLSDVGALLSGCCVNRLAR